MIPITAAIVGGTSVAATPGGAQPSRWRPVVLTLTYVLGLALVYSALGLFAGMTGTLFGSVSTNPWLYFAMANLLLIAALAMLDVLPVRVPTAILERASTAGTAGRASGAFTMGAMSGLVAAPCSAPVMAAVLTWVSTTKSAALGFRLPVRVLAGDVHAARGRRLVVGRDRAAAARRDVDGVGQAILRARDDRRRGILPREDGATDHMKPGTGRWTLVAEIRVDCGVRARRGYDAPTTARAQDLGIEVGSTAPAAKVHTLDGKEADLVAVHRQDAGGHGVLGDVVPELQGARADAARGVRRSTARRSSSSASRCR